MHYTAFSVRTRQNTDRTRLTVGTVCGKCGQPITKGQSYTVHAIRTAAMPAPSYHYYHTDHAPTHGSGWGEFRPGDEISDFTTLRQGDLLLEYCIQFDSYNVVRVLKTRWPGEPKSLVGRKFYGAFVDPTDPRKSRLHSNGKFCVWDHELGRACLLYRAVRT